MKRTIPLLFLATALAAPAAARAHDKDELHRTHELYLMHASQPRLGLHLQNLTPELRTHFGAPEDVGMLVAKVNEDSAAAKAGIRVGDVLVRIGDEKINSTSDAFQALRGRWDEEVEIEVIRNNRSRRLDALLDKKPEGQFYHPKDLGRFDIEVPRTPHAPNIKVLPRLQLQNEQMERLEKRLRAMEERLEKLERE